MKLLKRVLVFFLIVGVVGGIWGIWPHFAPLWRGYEGAREIKKKEQKIEVPLKFAVMADVHSDWENFRQALEKAKRDVGFEGFVVVVGDLTTIGKKSELLEAKKILDESGLKYYVIPGNHDIWYDRRLNKDFFSEVFGKTYGSFKKDNFKYILINNGDYKNGLEGLRGAEGQRKWLEEEAEECLRITCLIFMHMPLNHPNSAYVMGQDNPAVATQAAQLVKLLVKNKAALVFAGHLHFSSSYELEGLETTIVGAITSERNFQSPKFLEVSVSGDTILKKEIFLVD